MVKTNSNRVCPVCGTPLAGNSESCPVCALQGALTRESGASAIDSESELRFEHYQVLKNEDGAPIELGRGAMGITYKAFDVDLRCPVTLKVISEKYVGDESARLRFLREARAAAKVRHTNVASVLHLGRTGNGYFYAMEFVEGETLEKLIKSCGQLEVKLALEIVGQVAAGLGAVHRQNLVHRDIKPSNIMVSSEEGGEVIAKIIDLGLAKGLREASPESAISVPGGFAGTPEFASPEQFAGIGVDIRSDLYSLGVVLWEMLTGQLPFRGTPAELIYQHQHGMLPLKQLKGVPPQVRAALKALLDKDPKRRFQTPVELLKTLSMVRSELEKAAGQKHEVQKPRAQKSMAITEQPRPEPLYGEGLVEVSSDGFGFLRDPKRNCVPSPQDISVTPEVVRKHALRDGLWIKGEIRRGSRGSQLSRLTEINGEHPDGYRNLPVFEELTSLIPKSRIRLETVPDRYTTRLMDLMTPMGKGQRGLIVAPPRTGKTTLLKHIAEAVVLNHPEINLIILLVDERPEEVTEIRRRVPQADIMATSNDSDFKSHTRIAQLAIERAKRSVEAGKDVFVVMDSLTRIGRAFNNAMSNTGRTMSDGMDARAMEILRKLFAAARSTEEAGSLTIMATVLIETGSKMDELIFQEFKGTGNVEVVLDRQMSDQRVYPAIDIFKSGTRREELLIPANDLEKINTIRRGLAGHRSVEAIERLLSLLWKFPTNAQMLRETPGAVSYRRTGSSRTKLLERSVAVLPFESLSASKRDTYFADGVQDEILSNLAKISQLKVISRSSVMTYRPAASRDLRSIAAALGVARVIEGTVRRSGNRVRIATRLVDAQTGETLWSDSYDRDLTDVFAIQSEIAGNVAARLSARLSPEERKDIEQKPTDNLEAYDLYLQAKQLLEANYWAWTQRRGKEIYLKALSLLREAIQKDQKFALAYCLAAKAHGVLYADGTDHTPERRALGDAAVNEALRLRPDLPEAHLAMACHLYICYRDFERAQVQVAIAAKNIPNNPNLLHLSALIDQVQGHWEKAVADLERAVTLDPRNPDLLDTLARTYFNLRRYRDMERVLDRLIELDPDQPSHGLSKTDLAFAETADAKAVRADCEAPSVKDDPAVASYRVYYAICAHDFAAAEEILSENPNEEINFYGALVPRQIWALWLECIRGNHPTIEQFGAVRERLYQKVEAGPTDPYLLAALAKADVALGNSKEAIQEGRRAMEMLPISEDAVKGPDIATSFAFVCAWANQLDLAFEQLNILVKIPAGRLNYGDLKTYPGWEPLRKDPRFEKLLAQLAPSQSRRKLSSSSSRLRTRKPSVRREPKKISVARLPVTGRDVFGREEDIAFLDRAWANTDINIVTIAAWAGVGKSTLVNHWLRRMAAEQYRSAQLVFAWSFYRQGSSGETSSADEFLDAALSWFGDPDPRLGTAWQKGERLAKLVAHRRTLLVLDGLEPLQNPPGPQEGRLREPSLQALLRELAAFNKGLCVITTRTPVADIADHEQTSALRRDLEQLSSDAGVKLLRALGVKGDQPELRSASEEFKGHCLALTLLGSYLTDAFNGDIRFRKELSDRLVHDIRQGVQAQRVMESYQNWFGEGLELAVLRMLGLFDRPADEKAIAALLQLPAIPGLTESLTELSQIEWRTLITRLRRARLLAAEDPNNPGQLDAHPLVRQYFGDQLRSQLPNAWKESNTRLYNYYQALAPELPETFREMEPLFLAVICACNAGLFREALHEVYMPRIQRGDASFAAKVLGARGALLAILAHFYEQDRWGSLAKTIVEGEKLLPEDQVYVFMQAALNLTATRDWSAESQTCWKQMETLCRSLNRPRLLYVALMGQWNYSGVTATMSATMEIAKQVNSLATKEGDPALMMGAYRALAEPLYFSGNFENARDYATRAIRIWRSGVQSPVEEVDVPVVTCLTTVALCEWHFGEIDSSKSTIAEAISLARQLSDMQALALAILTAEILARLENNPSEVECLALDLVELSTRCNFATWLPLGRAHLGWARAVSGDVPRGLSRIEEAIQDYRRRGSVLALPYLLALKAEVLHLATRVSEALTAISEAEEVSDRTGVRDWSSELHRLRGVFLAAMHADPNQVKDSFDRAVSTARKQKSISLEKRAEATSAEYFRRKANSPS